MAIPPPPRPLLIGCLVALLAIIGVAAFVLLLADPNGRAWVWALAAGLVVMFALLAAAWLDCRR